MMEEKEKSAAKKQWSKPDFYLIDSDNVRSGVNTANNIHEGSAAGKTYKLNTNFYQIYNTKGSFKFAQHTVNFYQS